MVETLASPRIEQFIFEKLQTVPGGRAIYPDAADISKSPTTGIVFRELSPPVPVQDLGGHVTMIRSVWLAFVYGQRQTRFGLKATADLINAAIVEAEPQTVDGWTIQGVRQDREFWSRPVENGVAYGQLGGEFKIVASRSP